MNKGYETTLPASSSFVLTMPRRFMQTFKSFNSAADTDGHRRRAHDPQRTIRPTREVRLRAVRRARGIILTALAAEIRNRRAASWQENPSSTKETTHSRMSNDSDLTPQIWGITNQAVWESPRFSFLGRRPKPHHLAVHPTAATLQSAHQLCDK